MSKNVIKPYILILREIERANSLKVLLKKNKIKVLVEPLYEIQPIKFKPINFLNYQSLLITSVNTVKILKQQVSIDKLNNIKTYCVGKVTEKFALEAGFNCIKTNANSGVTLAKNVIKESNNNDRKILIIGAEVLAYDPTEIFRKSFLEIKKIAVYKKIPFETMSKKCVTLLDKDIITNIIIYSPETAKIFLSMQNNYNAKNIIITCLGEKTKNILAKKNWKKIQVIKNVELKYFANNIIKSII